LANQRETKPKCVFNERHERKIRMEMNEKNFPSLSPALVIRSERRRMYSKSLLVRLKETLKVKGKLPCRRMSTRSIRSKLTYNQWLAGVDECRRPLLDLIATLSSQTTVTSSPLSSHLIKVFLATLNLNYTRKVKRRNQCVLKYPVRCCGWRKAVSVSSDGSTKRVSE
jgi:hypothetical protein